MLDDAVDRCPALALRPCHRIGRGERIGAEDFGDRIFDDPAAMRCHNRLDCFHVGIDGALMSPFADQMDREFTVVEEATPRRDDFCAFLDTFPESALRRHHPDKRFGITDETVALHPLRLQEGIETECFGREPAPPDLAHRRAIVRRCIESETAIGKRDAIMDEWQGDGRLDAERSGIRAEQPRQIGTKGPDEVAPCPHDRPIGQHDVSADHARRNRPVSPTPEQPVLAHPAADAGIETRQCPP